MWHVEYRRPGESFCRVGSDAGFEVLEAATEFYRYQCKGNSWTGTVRVVETTDDETRTIMSTSLEDDYP